MSEGFDPKEAITRDDTESPKGPQNAKERLYEKLRGMPIWVLDALLAVLGIAVVVCLVLGFIKGRAG